MLICAGHVLFKEFGILMIKISLRIKFYRNDSKSEIKRVSNSYVVDKRESEEIREGIS